MGRRRKKVEEPENHERWVVSYADFITLLFAFFVVMYSISSINEGKYRVLSQTLTDAFQDPKRSLDPIQIGELNKGARQTPEVNAENVLIEMPGRDSSKPEKVNIDQQVSEVTSTAITEEQRLSYLAAAIEDMLEVYVEQNLVEVKFSDNRVMVDMKDKMLFPSGSARLSRPAVKALRDISRILASLPNLVQVEGNTDNKPIHTEEFPSNWELSAARAASVVHLMARMGIAPHRMSAIGYGEHRPVAANDTEAGRQKNRRVTLVVQGLNGSPDRTIHLSREVK